MKALQIIAGYLCAIIGTLLIHLFAITFFREFTNPTEVTFTFIRIINETISIVSMGLAIIIPATIIQSTIVIYSAEKHTIRFVTYYLLTGVATSISGLALVMFVITSLQLPYTGMTEEQLRIITIVYGFSHGMIAGFIYWLIAGRKAGSTPEARQTTN